MKARPKVVKVDREFLARVQCVCESVVLINGDQDEAPSLADTAEAARLVLQQLGVNGLTSERRIALLDKHADRLVVGLKQNGLAIGPDDRALIFNVMAQLCGEVERSVAVARVVTKRKARP